MFGSVGWSELIVLLFILGLIAIPQIFFIQTLNRTLALTQKHHTASPQGAWMLLIPIWGLFWIIYLVGKVAQGIKGRFSELKVVHEYSGLTTGYGYGYAALILAAFISGAVVGGLAAIVGLICWILYWVNIARYNKVLIRESVAT